LTVLRARARLNCRVFAFWLDKIYYYVIIEILKDGSLRRYSKGSSEEINI